MSDDTRALLCLITVLLLGCHEYQLGKRQDSAPTHSRQRLSADLFTYAPDAAQVHGTEEMRLTTNARGSAGSAFKLRDALLSSERLRVDFQAWFGEPPGGDGLAFTLLDPYRYPDWGEHDVLGEAGYYMGYGCGPDCPPDRAAFTGLTVEFDTYANEWEPSGPHVAIILDGDPEDHHAVARVDELADGRWRDVTVLLCDGSVTVRLDNAEVLSASVADMQRPFLGFIGFSAANGDHFARHAVREVHVVEAGCG